MFSVLGWWLCHLSGQPLPMPDHSFHEKIFPSIQVSKSTSLLPNKPCHPCPGLEREGSTTGTVVWGWEKLRAKTQDFSPVSGEDGVWGPEAFSKASPSAPKCPSSSGSGSCQQDISREQRHRCPSIYRNRRAPSLPAHPQESHSKSDFKSHSLGRVWSFLLWVQGKTAHSWCCSLPRARQGLEQGDFWMV